MIVELIRDNRKIVDRITQDQTEMFVSLLKQNKVSTHTPTHTHAHTHTHTDVRTGTNKWPWRKKTYAQKYIQTYNVQRHQHTYAIQDASIQNEYLQHTIYMYTYTAISNTGNKQTNKQINKQTKALYFIKQ